MPQIQRNALLLTSDPSLREEVAKAAFDSNVELMSFTETTKIEEKLRMQTVDFLLIDARIDENIAVHLLEVGWKLNALMLAAMLSSEPTSSLAWNARIIGAQHFIGENIYEHLKTLLHVSTLGVRPRDAMKILLVEDLEAPREIIAAFIQSLGYQNIETADSVGQALTILANQTGDFFCIVTDINLPKESGLFLISEVRNSSALKHLPIIVLTAYPTIDNLIECVRRGATGFLVKPPKKRLFRFELEKAERIYFSKDSARICREEDAHLLEEALIRMGIST